MASVDQVKKYLAHWFQLGKEVVLGGGRETVLPQPVLQGNGYSAEFEACWQRLLTPDAGDCYLQGTEITIAALLSDRWEVIDCARCEMPVPQAIAGLPPLLCPCHDLHGWPNAELPAPRSPVNTHHYLGSIRERLLHLPPTGDLNPTPHPPQ